MVIFDALGSLALGELPQIAAPVPVPVIPPRRISGGKLIAAYTLDDNGKLRRKMDAFIEEDNRLEEEMMTALLMYWRNRDN